jgi:dTDP-D-glucose 4,6-dehydratase
VLFVEMKTFPAGAQESLITFIGDRPSRDYCYAIDATKVRSKGGWFARVDFATGIVGL